jgi:hypothetical protein
MLLLSFKNMALFFVTTFIHLKSAIVMRTVIANLYDIYTKNY